MTLLSGFAHAGVVHAPAVEALATHAKPVTSSVVSLHGTLHGTVKLTGSTIAAVNVSGNLGAVGTATISINASLTNPPSSTTLGTKHGKLYLVGDGALSTTGNGGSITYTIEGGTGSYTHATGSGTITAVYSVAKGNKLSVSFKFS